MAEGAVAVGREADPVETELKLSATSAGPLRRLSEVAALDRLPLGAPETFLENDRYLDTDDGRLADAMWACRLRTRAGIHRVSLKGPQVANDELGGALHRRPEVEGPATARPDPAAWPASIARDRLIELADGRPLRERFTLRQTRTQRVVGPERRPIGALSLDRVLVVRDGEPMGTLWCVELELAGTSRPTGITSELLPGLLADLLATDGLCVEPKTKLERALALLDRAGY